MPRYFIHYTAKRCSDCIKVVKDCGEVWKHNVSPNVLRLDSEQTPMELQAKMNLVLNLNHEDCDAGDTYYLAVLIPTHCIIDDHCFAD